MSSEDTIANELMPLISKMKMDAAQRAQDQKDNAAREKVEAEQRQMRRQGAPQAKAKFWEELAAAVRIINGPLIQNQSGYHIAVASIVRKTPGSTFEEIEVLLEREDGHSTKLGTFNRHDEDGRADLDVFDPITAGIDAEFPPNAAENRDKIVNTLVELMKRHLNL